MVVRAPDVDEVVETAAELLGHVPDVGGEIGRLAVRAEDHPILVVAEIGRAEPDRAVLLVDVAAFAQPLDRPRDPALIVQARLARPDIEPDTEAGQARLDALADATGGPASELAVRVGVGQCRGQPDVVGHRRRQLVDVVAVVAIVGHGLAASEGGHRRAEVPDLRPRIVEVVLAGDLLTTGLEDAAEHVADEGPARVPDVERSGRVRRYEFDVHRARGSPARAPAHRRGSARTVAIVDSSAVSRSRRLRKPGGATSTDATGVATDGSVASALSSVARAVAIANGAILYGRASFIARLVARSPWIGSAGRSTSTVGRTASSGQAGSAPAATARSHARPAAAHRFKRP